MPAALPPRRPRTTLRRRTVSLACCATALLPLLSGCVPGLEEGQGPSRGTILYIAVGLETVPDLATELERQKQMRTQLRQLQTSFRDVQPGVHLELMVFNNERFVREIERRTRSGLAPDLMLVDGITAERLYERQLTTPISDPNPARGLLKPEVIPYVQAGPRQWFAVPVGLQPQLACFDRSRLPQSPGTMTALLEASSRGHTFGLDLDIINLTWTLGSLGALRSIAQVRSGAPVDPEQIGPIQTWLGWLRNADLQQRITLVGSQGELVEGLRMGRFDWIPCHSRDASQLRLSLGAKLGLAPLPSGPGGQATPISIVRVWAFGRNSSPNQHKAAQALVRFSLNPPVQRAFTIRTQGLLPVSRAATLPTASSANLAALIAAQAEASAAQELTESLIALRTERKPLNRILTRFRYGELNPPEAARALIAAMRRLPHE
ncbi:extracellular solute-binding protein [Cyanobium sp. NS01]|uniref:extracellular solute-binding protein n=1 Tax=Cyanobium sp. NS01 TaxID=261284 RepID=UPI001648B0BB|nr:extracellular solute-binding protein [Cyanobium sp. NS01]QNI71935.1 bacterial extracellular solute-binding protein [Cyanobium sp. NS01]